MAKIQVWFTENVLPEFTEDNKSDFSKIVENSRVGIGNVVNGRQLVRGLINEEDRIPINDYLTELGKEPIICDARYRDGNAVEDVEPNNMEYEKHFAMVEYTDEDGNPIMVRPSCNTSAGWHTYSELNNPM